MLFLLFLLFLSWLLIFTFPRVFVCLVGLFYRFVDVSSGSYKKQSNANFEASVPIM